MLPVETARPTEPITPQHRVLRQCLGWGASAKLGSTADLGLIQKISLPIAWIGRLSVMAVAASSSAMTSAIVRRSAMEFWSRSGRRMSRTSRARRHRRRAARSCSRSNPVRKILRQCEAETVTSFQTSGLDMGWPPCGCPQNPTLRAAGWGFGALRPARYGPGRHPTAHSSRAGRYLRQLPLTRRKAPPRVASIDVRLGPRFRTGQPARSSLAARMPGARTGSVARLRRRVTAYTAARTPLSAGSAVHS